jgi:hypothetical protein
MEQDALSPTSPSSGEVADTTCRREGGSYRSTPQPGVFDADPPPPGEGGDRL